MSDKLVVAMSEMAKRAKDSDVVAAGIAAAEMLRSFSERGVKTAEDVVQVVELAKSARKARLDLEGRAKKITDPLREAIAAVADEVRPGVTMLKAAEETAKQIKGKWDSEQERARLAALREEQARLDREAEAEPGPPTAVAYVPPAPAAVATPTAGMHSRRVPRVRIVDAAAAFAARPDLFDLKQGAAVKACQDAAPGTVPGLELYFETTQVLT